MVLSSLRELHFPPDIIIYAYFDPNDTSHYEVDYPDKTVLSYHAANCKWLLRQHHNTTIQFPAIGCIFTPHDKRNKTKRLPSFPTRSL